MKKKTLFIITIILLSIILSYIILETNDAFNTSYKKDSDGLYYIPETINNGYTKPNIIIQSDRTLGEIFIDFINNSFLVEKQKGCFLTDICVILSW